MNHNIYYLYLISNDTYDSYWSENVSEKIKFIVHVKPWFIQDFFQTISEAKVREHEQSSIEQLWDNGKKVSPESEGYEECLFGYSRIVHTDTCSFTLVFSNGNLLRDKGPPD